MGARAHLHAGQTKPTRKTRYILGTGQRGRRCPIPCPGRATDSRLRKWKGTISGAGARMQACALHACSQSHATHNRRSRGGCPSTLRGSRSKRAWEVSRSARGGRGKGVSACLHRWRRLTANPTPLTWLIAIKCCAAVGPAVAKSQGGAGEDDERGDEGGGGGGARSHFGKRRA